MRLFAQTQLNVFRLTESLNLQIETASNFGVDQIIEVVFKCFPQYESHEMKNFILSVTNLDKSFVLTDGTQLYGFYLLGDRQLHDIIDDEKLIPSENLESYKDKVGVEGVALGILPEYRKQGYANMLKNKVSGYDYICGLQFKELGNLQNWLKTRRVVASNNDLYLTLQDL